MPNYKSFERGAAAAAARGARNNNNNNNRRGGPRPPPGKKYLQFVLYKENTDTTAAIRDIQRRCGGGGGGRGGRGGRGRGRNQQLIRIGYAGNKDKRGITSQFVTVPATTNLASLCSWNRPGKGGGHTRNAGASVIRVGNFQYASNELQLGRLQGNHFQVVFRNVQQVGSDRAATKARLEQAASAIGEHGFINYFGVQRFGKFHDTHLTGISALKGDFEKAVDIIMQSKEGEREDAQKLRQIWRDRFHDVPDGDRAAAEKECAAKLARQFHRSMTAEVAIVNSLAASPLDYRRAFSSIPRTLRMMFVHAMQSYIWNKASSHRMQMASTSGDFSAHVGDLVLDPSSGGKNNSEDASLPAVKTLTAEDIETNKYTLEDVVLPLIGTKTRNPENECGALLDKLLHEQGVTLEMMKNVQDRDLHCVGDYRKLLCRPTDVEYNIVEYSDPLQPLLQTDLMKLNNIEVETVAEAEKNDGEKDPLLGLVVGFSLPSSSYATIFMRELMKRPTSADFQRELKLDSS